MDISRVKYCLNHRVHVRIPEYYVDGEYILTGCTIRKSGQQFYYLADVRAIESNSTITTFLKNVDEIKTGGKK